MILGLHGRLQAGKDTTFAEIEASLRGLVFVERLSFADPLKDSAAALLGITREELELMKVDPVQCITVRVPLDEGYRYRTINLTGREYLQRYGTESHRDVFGDNFWVDLALAKATDVSKLYVITDVRFPNEADAIHAADGGVIHIIGPQGKAAGGHSSEQALPDEEIDWEIDNSVRGDDFAHLQGEVGKFINHIRPQLSYAGSYKR